MPVKIPCSQIISLDWRECRRKGKSGEKGEYFGFLPGVSAHCPGCLIGPCEGKAPLSAQQSGALFSRGK